MMFVWLCLIGFGVADLLRWSPELVSHRRMALASLGSVVVTFLLAGLSRLSLLGAMVLSGGWRPRAP
jgi:hypothetical protein